MLLGLVCQWAGICPIVKRVWTSSYTLYSGGLVVLILAGFYALIELERLAAMGVSAGRGRNELDCHLRDELDDGGFLRRRHGSPHWECFDGDIRTDFSANAPRFRGDADLLAHLVLDVSAEDLFEDLSLVITTLHVRKN